MAAGDYGRNDCSGNNVDTLSSVSFVSFREAHAEVHTISWKGASFGCIWSSGGLLLEKGQSVCRKPGNTGGGLDSGGDCAAFMEKADAAFHSGRNGVLYASGAVCLLRRIVTDKFNEL